MELRLSESWVNREHTVLGRQLHDYCFYDVFFLSLDGNPLLTRHRGITREDLASAVLICSTPSEQLLRSKLMPRWRRRLWGYRTRKQSLEAEAYKFSVYQQDFDARPIYWEDEAGGEGLRAPWILSVAAFIEDHSNMTEHQIMTAPIGKMLWKSAALAEILGVSKAQIMREDEQEAVKEMGLDV